MKTKVNENTMWPEKIAAIYDQFPWLELFFLPSECVERAYVKRFDESTLDIKTSAKHVHHVDNVFLRNVPNHETSIYLIEGASAIKTMVGQSVKVLNFGLFRYRLVGYFNETVRQAIRRLPLDSKANYVVVITLALGHYKTVTVYKPPEKLVTLRQWYDEKATSISRTTMREIAST